MGQTCGHEIPQLQQPRNIRSPGVAIAHGLFPNPRIVARNASDADAPFESTASRDLTSTFITGPSVPRTGSMLPHATLVCVARPPPKHTRASRHGTWNPLKLNQISLALEKNALPHFTTRPSACVGPILQRILNGGMVTSDIRRRFRCYYVSCVELVNVAAGASRILHRVRENAARPGGSARQTDEKKLSMRLNSLVAPKADQGVLSHKYPDDPSKRRPHCEAYANGEDPRPWR
jgi:hypothetical protein